MFRFASFVAVLALGIVDARAKPPAQGVGVWDGAPSIGGAWIAHPDHDGRASPLVTIRTEAGAETQARLVRRGGVGRGYLLAAETARALDLEPGEPALLTIVELAEPPEDAEQAEAMADDAESVPAAMPGNAAESGALEKNGLSTREDEALRDGEATLAPQVVSIQPPPRPQVVEDRDVAVGLSPPDAAPLPRARPAVRAAAPASAAAESSGEAERNEPSDGDRLPQETGDVTSPRVPAPPPGHEDRVEGSPSSDTVERGEHAEAALADGASVDAVSRSQASAAADASFADAPNGPTGDDRSSVERTRLKPPDQFDASGATSPTRDRAASVGTAQEPDRRDDAVSDAAPEQMVARAETAAPRSPAEVERVVKERLTIPPSGPRTSFAESSSPNLSQRPARRPSAAAVARPEASPPPMPRPVPEGAPA